MQVVPVATFFLGYWQVQRRKWKTELIERVRQQMHEEPVPLAQM